MPTMCKILILLLLWLSDHPDLNWGALLAWKWPRNKRHTSQRSSTKQKMRNTACWVFSSSGVSLCSNFGFSIRPYPVYVNLPFSSPIFWFIWPITLYIQLIIHIFLLPCGNSQTILKWTIRKYKLWKWGQDKRKRKILLSSLLSLMK